MTTATKQTRKQKHAQQKEGRFALLSSGERKKRTKKKHERAGFGKEKRVGGWFL